MDIFSCKGNQLIPLFQIIGELFLKKLLVGSMTIVDSLYSMAIQSVYLGYTISLPVLYYLYMTVREVQSCLLRAFL